MDRQDPTDCVCGGKLWFDEDAQAQTQGGLWLRGWLRCTKCTGVFLSRRSVASVAPVWRSTGRAVDLGCLRLRPDGGADIPSAELSRVLALVAKTPSFERALRAIARGVGDAHKIAAEALLEQG